MEDKNEAYLEVREVINSISDEQKAKLPNNFKEALEEKTKNKGYSLQYDSNGDIILSDEAKAILVYLYQQYIIKDNEQLQDAFRLKMKENASINKIIKDKTNESIVLNELFPKDDEKEEITLVKIEKKESFFSKIVNAIKKFFNIKSK